MGRVALAGAKLARTVTLREPPRRQFRNPHRFHPFSPKQDASTLGVVRITLPWRADGLVRRRTWMSRGHKTPNGSRVSAVADKLRVLQGCVRSGLEDGRRPRPPLANPRNRERMRRDTRGRAP